MMGVNKYYTLGGAEKLCRGAIKSGRLRIYDNLVEYIEYLSKKDLLELVKYAGKNFTKDELMDLVMFFVNRQIKVGRTD